MIARVPCRIRRSRAKGSRLPAGAVIVDRTSRWGNPFIIGQDGTGEYCVHLHQMLLTGHFRFATAATIHAQRAHHSHVAAHIGDLRGRDLACWCRLCPEHRDGLPLGVKCEACSPCHADVLLELANGD